MRGLVAAISVLCSSVVLASQSDIIHQPYMGVRPVGMGNAFTAVADDYNALFYNPAGLARLQSGEINLGFRGMLTASARDTVNSIQTASKTGDALQTLAAINSNLGKHEATEIGVDAFWVRPHWGIGFIPVDTSAEIDLRGGGPVVGVQAYQDSTLAFGYAKNFGENDSLSVGVTAKGIYRAYLERDLKATDLASGSQQIVNLSDAKEGLAIDGDVGTLYTVQIPKEGWFKWLNYAKPTFGFVVRNIADQGYINNLHLLGKGTGDNPAKLERRFDLGSKWELPEFWVFQPRAMIDGRDMGTRYASFKKCLHVGAELLWKVGGLLHGGYRMGFSEGYLTAGISATLLLFQLDLATYSEELGTSDSPRESRRYVLKASLDF